MLIKQPNRRFSHQNQKNFLLHFVTKNGIIVENFDRGARNKSTPMENQGKIGGKGDRRSRLRLPCFRGFGWVAREYFANCHIKWSVIISVAFGRNGLRCYGFLFFILGGNYHANP
ncbi:MAG: hypothetical protein IKU10_01160 [Clostridia bacterium]|nr:hypothetical protein [Clostridia bacterium]